MNMKQAGFTLIELVMVIVILGILAAIAVPKFIDLQSDARTAATQGVAGGVSSAFAINYAAYAVAGTAKGVQISGTVSVNPAAGSIMAGGMPTGYTATAAAASTVLCGTSVALAIPITISATVGATTTASATLVCTG